MKTRNMTAKKAELTFLILEEIEIAGQLAKNKWQISQDRLIRKNAKILMALCRDMVVDGKPEVDDLKKVSRLLYRLYC